MLPQLTSYLKIILFLITCSTSYSSITSSPTQSNCKRLYPPQKGYPKVIHHTYQFFSYRLDTYCDRYRANIVTFIDSVAVRCPCSTCSFVMVSSRPCSCPIARRLSPELTCWMKNGPSVESSPFPWPRPQELCPTRRWHRQAQTLRC